MGTTWAIAQQGANVTSMSAHITCNTGYRASWRGEGFRWASAAALTYTIHLSNGAVETHVTTFNAPDAATVEVYPAGQSRKSATVHLRRQ